MDLRSTSKRTRIRKCASAMKRATTYVEWYGLAEELDRLEGRDRWRVVDESPCYEHALLRNDLRALRNYRTSSDFERSATLLHETLHRHLGDLGDPALYNYAHAGTKNLIVEYLDEVVASLDHLCDTDFVGLSLDTKITLFDEAYHNFGRSALLLSGGATFGLFHIGVGKALWQEGLLPSVISGASMGAIVAASLCTRNDRELSEFFSHPERIYIHAFRFAKPDAMLRRRAIMDPAALLRNIRANAGDFTFEEAYRRTGRILNISLSPNRPRQKPRLLNYRTAPELLIARSALASCAVPGLFPPGVLIARDRNGRRVAYMPSERWIDGSFHGDLPMTRLGRLHNINHFIVSQTNPHVLPFAIVRQRPDMLSLTVDLAASSLHAQRLLALDVVRHHTRSSSWRRLLDKLHSMGNQETMGDINICPPFNLVMYRKVLANPTRDDLYDFILRGERATWPRIPMIRDQTRISRAFEQCLARLRHRRDAAQSMARHAQSHGGQRAS